MKYKTNLNKNAILTGGEASPNTWSFVEVVEKLEIEGFSPSEAWL